MPGPRQSEASKRTHALAADEPRAFSNHKGNHMTTLTAAVLISVALGVVLGLLLAHIVWAAVTNHGERPFPKLVCRWER